MKLKLLRCSICDHWHAPFRGHCPSCGSTPLLELGDRKFHLDVNNNQEIVKGFYEYRMRNVFESSREQA